MDNSQLNNNVKQILDTSREIADHLHNLLVRPEHFMLGILQASQSRAVEALRRQGVDIDALRNSLLSTLMSNDDDTADTSMAAGGPWLLTRESDRTLKLSMLEARMLHNRDIDAEHLVLAMLKDSTGSVSHLLQAYNIDYTTFYHEIEGMNRNATASTDAQTQPAGIQPEDYASDSAGYDDDDDDDDPTDGEWEEPSPISQATSDQKPDGNNASTPLLDRYGTDMTRAAEEGKLDPVVGRETEIERVAQILTRRKKNNPILIGEPGVGKSAIVEGLAQRIARHEVSYFLQNRRVISLDMAGMVAGTKYRGEFEQRIKGVMQELRRNPDIIIFIDEIHTLIGAGNAAGSMDAANILKPALARGEIQCIGATTIDEFRKSIERDGALERRFQKVMVEPTTADETLQILHNLRDRYEQHHHVRFTDAALEACVRLTDRYVSDRNFPDKAIDAMDEAGSRMHLLGGNVPADITETEHRLAEVRAEKDQSLLTQRYEDAATYRDEERRLDTQLKALRAEWERKQKDDLPIVDDDKVAEVVAQVTGIPVTKVASSESQKLLGLRSTLQSHIIGQDKAIDRVVRAIQRNRVGLKDPRKPIGTFLFLGPTGVGKTYLAKQLASEMFAARDTLIRVDMTEFMEKHTVSKLIGAPPGYVGYDEGGQLTERVRRHPYSVVLFDEIEKAHPDVFNLMLQIFDDGQLTDSYGRRVSFKNTIIIMTSNVGSRQLKDFGTGIGFADRTAAEDNNLAAGVIQKALQKTFSPEFINRIDDIITFDQLSQADIRRIVDLELHDFESRIAELGYDISISGDVRDFLAQKGYDRQYGARPLKRAIDRYIEDELSEGLLAHPSKSDGGQPVHIDVAMADGKPVFAFAE